MNFFVSAEQRRMHRYVDSTVEKTAAILALDGFSEQLGEHTTEMYKNILSNYFVPNLRHDQVSLPKSVTDNDTIPIIGLELGKEVRYGDGVALTPAQKRRFVQKMQSWSPMSPIATIEQDVESTPYYFANHAFSLPQSGRLSAVVVSPVLEAHLPFENIGNDNKRLLLGRPLVAMAMRGGEYKSPRVLMHESRHVWQALTDPVRRGDEKNLRGDSYRRELEAYALQAVFEYALATEPSYQPNADVEDNAPTFATRDNGSRYINSGALAINYLRHQANINRRDKYFPDGSLIKKLDEYGIDLV